MGKVRVVYMPDKSVQVLHPSSKSIHGIDGALKRQYEKDPILNGLPYDDIDSSALPQSREDRGAWEGKKGKGITVNQVKAKEIKDEKERKRLIEEEKHKLAEQSLKDKGVIK